MFALVSSPFQYALASCSCLGCQRCNQIDSVECCESSTDCCCCSEITKSAETDTSEACCSSCSSCGAQCQCGALEVTPSENQIAQTETAGSPMLIAKLAPVFTGHRSHISQFSQVSSPDLVSLRLHLIKYGALALALLIVAIAGYSVVSTSPDVAAKSVCCCSVECLCPNCQCTCSGDTCSCESCCCDGSATCDCGKEALAAKVDCCCGAECLCTNCQCTCSGDTCSCENCCCDGSATCDCGAGV